jgi:flagellar motility protein MotE (MotC chaperone)
VAKENTINEETKTESDIVPPVEKSSKKKKGKLVPLLMIFLIIGMSVAVLGFNAFNIREKYLRDTLKNVPVLKNLLSKTVEDATVDETITTEQLQLKIDELQKLAEDNKNTIAMLTNSNNDLGLENKRLKDIEAQQVQFKKDKAEFDRLLALNDPAAYSAFYEKISPENAQNLYTQAKLTATEKQAIKKYTESFETMSADAAAGVMEEMVQTDINLVVLILKNIDSEQSGKILAAMDPVKAAKVVKRLAPTLTTTTTN